MTAQPTTSGPSSDMDPRTALLMETARDLLHLSKFVGNQNRFEHYRAVSDVLASLLSANTRLAVPLTLEQRKAISVVFQQEGVMAADLLAEEDN